MPDATNAPVTTKGHAPSGVTSLTEDRANEDAQRAIEMGTNMQILGREHINDLEAILSVSNTDVAATVHTVKSEYDTIFTWDYEKGSRPKLNRLYEKAKTSQWNGETDLPWDTDVDQEAVVMANQAGLSAEMDLTGTPFAKWGDKEWLEFGVESQNWTLSQFMHGEQGALICTARIVENVPWIDAKYYASTQVMDEARHVEVFAKYLDTKLSGHYPINTHLRMLLDDIIRDDRWDMTYLGMQIMVEGLALAAFGFMHMMTTEPLLKQLLRYVMSDEARHVAFGVLSLQDYYKELSAPELRERQEFAFEAAVRMRDRFLQQEVYERMGVPVKDALELVLAAPDRNQFQALLFSKIVPNCKKLGLLDAADGWLRTKFTELGVIQFEDMADTGEEYDMFALANGDLRSA
ncbi:MAG: ferritin-like domain-containing protein [Acidimicrobiales bacterium]